MTYINKYLEIVIIVSIVISMLFIASKFVNGYSYSSAKEVTKANKALTEHLANSIDLPLPLATYLPSDTVGEHTKKLLSACAAEFESGDGSNFLRFCDKLMVELHKICKSTYFEYCWQKNVWNNYDTSKFKVKEK